MIDKFTYKETDYVNALLQNGFMTQYDNYEMSLLCKFWKETGVTKKEARQNLIYFCELYSDSYDEMLYHARLDRIVNGVYRKENKLIQIDYVPIYKHEFEYIQSCDLPHPYQRLLFAFLVLKKIHSEIWVINGGERKLSGLINGDKKQFKIVSEMAHLKGGKKEDIFYMIYDLAQQGMVTSLALAQVYLNFIDELKENESEEIVRVSDFEHVWMYYDYLSGYNRAGRVVICQECNSPYHAKSNRQKYCNECAVEKQRERDLEYRRRVRSSSEY